MIKNELLLYLTAYFSIFNKIKRSTSTIDLYLSISSPQIYLNIRFGKKNQFVGSADYRLKCCRLTLMYAALIIVQDKVEQSVWSIDLLCHVSSTV